MRLQETYDEYKDTITAIGGCTYLNNYYGPLIELDNARTGKTRLVWEEIPEGFKIDPGDDYRGTLFNQMDPYWQGWRGRVRRWWWRGVLRR